MATQDGTMMSKKENDLSSQKVARAMSYFRSTQLRGEQAEERMLDEMIARARAEKQQAQNPNTASASHPTKMQNEDMLEQMTLEDYKQKVKQCLMQRYNNTTRVENLMRKYEDDFPELLGWNLTPQTASGVIASGLY